MSLEPCSKLTATDGRGAKVKRWTTPLSSCCRPSRISKALIYPDQSRTHLYYKTRRRTREVELLLKSQILRPTDLTSLILQAMADFTSVNRLVYCFCGNVRARCDRSVRHCFQWGDLRPSYITRLIIRLLSTHQSQVSPWPGHLHRRPPGNADTQVAQ